MLPALICAVTTPFPRTRMVQTPTMLGRRSAVAVGATLFAPWIVHADEPVFTKGDAFQLRASFNELSDALNAWRVEIAQVQLGNEPSSVVAVAGINDVQLQRLALVSQGAAGSVASFKKSRDVMLQNLFLARGAARYEKDSAVAVNYIETARMAALAAQSDLEAIAAVAGIELTRKKRAAPLAAPEDAVVFTPRAAASVENRLTF